MFKTDDPNFLRDERSHALINTNVGAFKLYKQQRSTVQTQMTQEQKIASLENELSEMRALLKELINRENND
jgi:hypothetical protein